MAKIDKWERQHRSHLSAYERQIDRLYREIVAQFSVLGASIDGALGDDIFSFADHPELKRRVARLLAEYQRGVEAVIVNGVNAEWTLANNKNSELSRRVFGDNVGRLSHAQYRRYFSTNDNAREAFLRRKTGGLKLSDRVWRYTDQFKGEIELGLDVGIRGGLSAAEMSRELQQYLKYPDKLFRRVRDEHGELQLSKRAAEFHSGQGVYRSSYKNARRLAVTETNIAYRTADYERWQDLDFVVGIKIVLSNNHPEPDICDDLAGRYPKDFKFTGWHPHCRCHVETILKTDEEIERDTDRILRGEQPLQESANTVSDVPQEFKAWMKDNEERSKHCYSVPYFMSDNPQYTGRYLRKYATKLPYPTFEEYEQAMKWNREHETLTPELRENIRALNEALPVVRGQIMPFGAADGGHCNPLFRDTEESVKAGYHHNCQTCTTAYELRRRGFDIEALPSPKGEKNYFWDWAGRNGITDESRFLTPDGKPLKYTERSTFTGIKDREEFIVKHTTEVGRYEVYCQWDNGGSHVFIVERQKKGNLVWYDPQTHKIAEDIRLPYLKSMRGRLGVRRIDNALVNPKLAERLRKSSK